MQSGLQTKGISYWEHGALVAARFRDLMNPNPNMIWRLPKWFIENADWIRSEMMNQFDDISTYMQWHDLSKPMCMVIDEAGRVHYPDHAAMAECIWLSLGGDVAIGKLIGRDMDMHTIKPSMAGCYKHLDIALILLVSALCELHANASLFGGIQSDSFKIKFKNLERLGCAFFRIYGVQGLASSPNGSEVCGNMEGDLP